jgi:predicted MFS family arabinose efflux permease
VAARWFEKRRGLVVGMMTASNATGQLIFLPLLASLAETIGWRAALVFVAASLTIAFVLAALFLRDHPADVGLPIYGRADVTAVPRRAGRLRELLTAPLLTLRDAAKTQVFWALFATFYVCGFSTNGLIQQHWISICGDVGITPTGAAGYLALIGAFDFAGTILSGWLSDRYDNRWLLLAYYGLRGLSLLYLPFSGFSLLTLTAFAVFYGLDWVATVPPTVKLTAARFGAEKAGLVFGWVFAGHQLGAASAAFIAGAVRTGTQSYYPAILLAGVFCVLAAVLILSIGKRPSLPIAAVPAE